MCRALVPLLVVAACRGAPPAATPLPEPTDPGARGDAAAAAALAPEERDAIYAAVLGFYRPSGRQARWIDPRPLAPVRDAAADSGAVADEEWALGLREAAAGTRVCLLDAEDERCRGRAGGILRLSRAYAAGDGEARVFVVYTPARDAGEGPARAPGPVMESVFTLERRGGGWRIAHHRPVRAP